MFQTFARLNKYRFIVYADRIDLNVSVSDNVNVTRWLPQNELLGTLRRHSLSQMNLLCSIKAESTANYQRWHAQRDGGGYLWCANSR